MIAWEQVKVFYDYLEFYPGEDEDGYDGVHDGGWKGVRDDAPDEVKQAYADYVTEQEKAEKQGIRR